MRDVSDAISLFYDTHKIKPNIIKMAHRDLTQFLGSMHNVGCKILEKNKEYGLFVPTASGVIEIVSADDEFITNVTDSLIIVEYNEIDRIIEQVVLGGAMENNG